MKKFLNITLIQFLLSVISAMLLSQMSWIGKMGITFFYKSYEILKSPLKTGAAIFLMQLLIILILHLFNATASRKVNRIVCVFIFILAVLGLAYTVYDFNQEFSHRILKSKFHYGGYLIWVAVMFTSLYYFFQPGKKHLAKVAVVENEE